MRIWLGKVGFSEIGLTAANALATLSFALVSPLLARALHPGGRGDLAAAQTFIALAPVFVGGGMRDSAAWIASKDRALKNLSRYVRRRSTLWVGAAMVCYAVLGTIEAVRGAQGYAAAIAMAAMVILAPAQLMAETVVGTWLGRGLARQLTLFLAVPALCQAAGLAVLSFMHKLTPISGALWLILWVAAGIAYRIRVGELSHDEASRYSVEATIKAGHSWYPGLVSSVVLSRLDVVFLTFFAAPRILGIYAVASTAGLLAQPALPALQPRALRAAHQGRAAMVTFQVRVLCYAAPILGACAAVGWYGVPLVFGHEYRDSRAPFVLLVLSALGNLSVGLSVNALGSWDRVGVIRRASVAALFLAFAAMLAQQSLAPNALEATTTAAIMAAVSLILAISLLLKYPRRDVHVDLPVPHIEQEGAAL